MKKIFSFLAVALMSISAMAGTVVFTAADFTGGAASPGAHMEATKDGVTVSTENGFVSTDHIRVFGGGNYTLDFTSTSTMTKIEFEWASTGNKYTGSDTETPNAKTFSVTASAQMRIAKITVTLDGEGGGTTGGGTTGGGTTGGGTTGGSTIVINNDFLMVDAYNFDDEDGKGWSFDFYSEMDEETYYVYGEELYFHFFSNKTTSINGTYSIEMGYYFKDDEDEEGVEFTSGTVTIAAKGTKNEYDEPIYQFTATFQAPDGNTYTLNKSFGVYATNDDGDITLNENGGTTGGGTTQEGQAITVAEAIAIGGKLADKAETAETYTVVGYVGKIAKDYDAEKKNQCWFMCDDKAEVGSDAYFNFEAYWCYIDAPVALGDYVSVTGKIMKYGKTIEIMNGQAKKISAPTGVKNAELELKAVKSLENGTLIIRRGEKTYNVLGAQL